MRLLGVKSDHRRRKLMLRTPSSTKSNLALSIHQTSTGRKPSTRRQNLADNTSAPANCTSASLPELSSSFSNPRRRDSIGSAGSSHDSLASGTHPCLRLKKPRKRRRWPMPSVSVQTTVDSELKSSTGGCCFSSQGCRAPFTQRLPTGPHVDLKSLPEGLWCKILSYSLGHWRTLSGVCRQWRTLIQSPATWSGSCMSLTDVQLLACFCRTTNAEFKNTFLMHLQNACGLSIYFNENAWNEIVEDICQAIDPARERLFLNACGNLRKLSLQLERSPRRNDFSEEYIQSGACLYFNDWDGTASSPEEWIDSLLEQGHDHFDDAVYEVEADLGDQGLDDPGGYDEGYDLFKGDEPAECRVAPKFLERILVRVAPKLEYLNVVGLDFRGLPIHFMNADEDSTTDFIRCISKGRQDLRRFTQFALPREWWLVSINMLCSSSTLSHDTVPCVLCAADMRRRMESQSLWTSSDDYSCVCLLEQVLDALDPCTDCREFFVVRVGKPDQTDISKPPAARPAPSSDTDSLCSIFDKVIYQNTSSCESVASSSPLTPRQTSNEEGLVGEASTCSQTPSNSIAIESTTPHSKNCSPCPAAESLFDTNPVAATPTYSMLSVFRSFARTIDSPFEDLPESEVLSLNLSHVLSFIGIHWNNLYDIFCGYQVGLKHPLSMPQLKTLRCGRTSLPSRLLTPALQSLCLLPRDEFDFQTVCTPISTTFLARVAIAIIKILTVAVNILSRPLPRFPVTAYDGPQSFETTVSSSSLTFETNFSANYRSLSNNADSPQAPRELVNVTDVERILECYKEMLPALLNIRDQQRQCSRKRLLGGVVVDQIHHRDNLDRYNL